MQLLGHFRRFEIERMLKGSALDHCHHAERPARSCKLFPRIATGVGQTFQSSQDTEAIFRRESRICRSIDDDTFTQRNTVPFDLVTVMMVMMKSRDAQRHLHDAGAAEP